MGSDSPFVFLKTVEILATQIQDQTPPLCSENDGDSGGADPGSDPPLTFKAVATEMIHITGTVVQWAVQVKT